MARLLFISYFTLVFHFGTCFHDYDIDGVFSSPPGNNFNNIFGFGESHPGAGANRGHKRPLRIFRQSDFIFDEDNEFNDVVVPNRPPATPSPLFPQSPNNPPTDRRPTTPQPFGTTTVKIPGMGTTRSACEDACRATSQFDPVCGDNNVTYTNIYWFRCAQKCGRNVNIKHYGACPRVR